MEVNLAGETIHAVIIFGAFKSQWELLHLHQKNCDIVWVSSKRFIIKSPEMVPTQIFNPPVVWLSFLDLSYPDPPWLQ